MSDDGSRFVVVLADDEVTTGGDRKVEALAERLGSFLRKHECHDRVTLDAVFVHRTMSSRDLADRVVKSLEGCVGWMMFMDMNHYGDMYAGVEVLKELDQRHSQFAQACSMAVIFTKFVSEAKSAKDRLAGTVFCDKFEVTNRIFHGDQPFQVVLNVLSRTG